MEIFTNFYGRFTRSYTINWQKTLRVIIEAKTEGDAGTL